MSDYLPPVVARLSMDMGDFLSGIAKAKAAMKGLGGDFKVGTDGLDAAIAKVKALQTALNGLNGTVRVNTDGIGTLAAKTTAAGAATGAATAVMVNGWRLTATALHWIIAGGAELAAVAIPALVALAAGMAVMSQGAQMVQQHMQALNTATSATSQMFGQTTGDVLGLGHALQTAQDAANPSVYGILGSAIIGLKGHIGQLTAAGLQVAQMFQTFAAKVAVDFGPNGALGNKTAGLFSHMTADLQGLGQVLGNVGHTFVNFASAMPGLAEVLLRIVSGVTLLASHLSGIAGPLITIVMGMEEFSRWGGAVVSILARLGATNIALTGGILSFERLAGVIKGFIGIIPAAIAGMARLTGMFGESAMANGLTKASYALQTFIAELTVAQTLGIGALAIGFGVLTYKIITAKTAAQEFADSMQRGLMGSTNVQALQTAATNIGALNAKLHSTPALIANASRSFQNGNQNVTTFNAAIKQQAAALTNVVQGAAYLAKAYGTTFVGALALADLANVKLAAGILGTSSAAMVARMQIASLVQGYEAMGQSSGQVGADMTALAIQSGLAASNVTKLNSAWDDFQHNLTGGTSALAGFMTSMSNITSVVASFHNNLGKALSIKDSVSQFAQALKGFGTAGAAAWQNFDQVVGSTAPQLIDWMRTAGAEGALSAGQFKQAGLDMVAGLMPLGAASKTARAEIMGLVQQIDPSIQTWSQLSAAVKNSGASMNGLGGIIGGATQKMANMQSVASTLGSVLNTALISALQAAQVSASGAGAAMQKYAQDLMNAGTSAAQTQGDYQAVMGDLEKLGLSAKQAAALIAQVTQNLAAVQSKTVTLTVIERSISSGGAPPPGVAAPGIPGHAAGTPSAAPGWAWVGEAGPELVKFRGGEQVMPNSVSMGYANGTGGFGEQHIHLYIDGREISAAVAKQAVSTQRRTGHNGMQRRTR